MNLTGIFDNIKLPTLSGTLSDIIELEKTRPPGVQQELEAILEKDPIFSAHILKVANSSLYDANQKIRIPAHAISILGIENLINIAFSYSTVDFFSKVNFNREYIRIFNQILKKSSLTAAIASGLAREQDYQHPDEFYLAGQLLHIGQLILLIYSPEKYGGIYTHQDEILVKKEREMFGVDYIEIGRELVERWKFPAYISRAIQNQLQLREKTGENVKITHISRYISEFILSTELQRPSTEEYQRFNLKLKENFKLSFTRAKDILQENLNEIDLFAGEFSQLHRDLENLSKKFIHYISELINNEIVMEEKAKIILKKQVKIFKEKDFLKHLFNITTELPALKSARDIMVFLCNYFSRHMPGLEVEFVHTPPHTGEFYHLSRTNQFKERKVNPEKLASLSGSASPLEPVTLAGEELKYLGKKEDSVLYSFPLISNGGYFGSILLNSSLKQADIISFELKYLNILVKMVANSLQNISNFSDQKIENKKKELLISELTRTDKKLNLFTKELAELQKNDLRIQILPKIFHKLKNMLTPILGYSQLLLLTIHDPTHKKRIEKIENNANKLAAHLNLLKDHFSGSKTKKKAANLNRLIKNMASYFAEIRRVHHIQLEFNLAPDLRNIELNQAQIEALLTHICQNAVEAIKAKKQSGGIIKIHTANLEKDKIILSISDNGIGIKKKDLELVVNPFFSTHQHKSGIGLTICEGIVINHQGELLIDSIPGQFTRVEMQFPALKENPDQCSPDREIPAGKHNKILIIHDRENKESVIGLIKDVLEHEPSLEIINTSSEGAAIQYLESGEFDLIIMDLNSKKIKPDTQINQLLKINLKNNKILFINSSDKSKDNMEAYREFNFEVFQKPFEIMKIKNQIFNKLK